MLKAELGPKFWSFWLIIEVAIISKWLKENQTDANNTTDIPKVVKSTLLGSSLEWSVAETLQKDSI